ncbi:unnamed protein product, partial [Mesorhabditis spiculigera]
MVAKILLLSAAIAAVAAELGCEDGWTLGKGTDQCYKRFDDLTDYNRAEVVCKELGAELPNIHSEAENAAIHALDVPNQRLRLGATRFGSGKYDFKWSNGSPMDFTKFDDASMGNSYGYENCLDMAEVDRWNDVRCDMPEIIVCQKKGSHISTGK